MAACLRELSLRVPLRPSQQRVVTIASSPAARADRRLHLSSPPGSGKTIVGLELAVRLGQPTVVFAPTTTIVSQWRSEVRRFLPDGADLDAWVSTDPTAPAPVTVLTYQSLAVTARPDRELRELARRAWLEELAEAGTADPEAWLAALAERDGAAVQRELRSRAAGIRRRRLRDGVGDVHRHLHPNARALVDRLVEHGVRTVVLDECHHLLDHWALVLLDLFDRIEARPGPDLHVVGLTATLPEPDSTREQETYRAVLGEVDVEIPTPVVVAEGALAPYRDLVHVVAPTPAEQAFLDDVAGAMRTLLGEVTTSEAFLGWLVAQVQEAAGRQRTADAELDASPTDRGAWSRWLRERPIVAGAVLRAHRSLGLSLPTGLPVPADADLPFGVDDRLTLLEAFDRDVLSTSTDPDHVALRRRLVEVLRTTGVHVGSTGFRRGRSPVDLVLERSRAKAHGAATVLAAEHDHLGDRLRALVVTDLDRVPTPVALLRGVLEQDAGSARHLHRALVRDAAAGRLDPVLVTGSTVRAGHVVADELATHCNLWFAERGLDAWCAAAPVDHVAQELVGHGADWTTRHIVPAVTDAFTAGVTRCLVGTRGLFGQGWDAPCCNTLVDLTAATTATAARQLQGRVLRLDPAWPSKAAHRWDVVCVAPDVPGGEADLRRFQRRHERLWGVAARPDGSTTVVRGVEHVDPRLARALEDGHRARDLADATARSLAAVEDRDRLREVWDGVSVTQTSEVRTRVRVRPRRQAHVDVAPDRAGAGWVALGASGAAALAGGVLASLPVAAVVGAGAVVGAAAGALQRRRHAAGRALAALATGRHALPPAQLDRLLLAAGQAVRDALVACGELPELAVTVPVTVHRNGSEASITLDDHVEDGPTLLPVHHRRFAEDVAALLGPVGTPRYLLETVVGGTPVLLPAPARLAGRRDRADALAAALRTHLRTDVRAVWAHGEEGRELLVGAWAQRRSPLRLDPEDHWS